MSLHFGKKIISIKLDNITNVLLKIITSEGLQILSQQAIFLYYSLSLSTVKVFEEVSKSESVEVYRYLLKAEQVFAFIS